jgi:hypothetical protein
VDGLSGTPECRFDSRPSHAFSGHFLRVTKGRLPFGSRAASGSPGFYPAQALGNRFHGLRFCTRHDVGVGVRGGHGRAMAEDRGHRPNVDVSLKKPGRRAVPHVVKPRVESFASRASRSKALLIEPGFHGRRGFTRIVRSPDGQKYRLPTAEYSYEGTMTGEQVRSEAKAAAADVGKAAGALVTEAGVRWWSGLLNVGS